jgi:outer membrane protein TolC
MILCLSLAALGRRSSAQIPGLAHLPESRCLRIRDPAELCRARIPETDQPITVRHRRDRAAIPISLDETIRIGLQNTGVVRVLAGTAAVSSGRTVYDPGVANTVVDEAQSPFDPVIDSRHNFLRNETPSAVFDPTTPGGVLISGSRSDSYDMSTGVTKRFITGADAAVRIDTDRSRLRPGLFPLNPETRSSLTMSLTQPLLQGGGVAVNLAPIVVARIDTERSFFQLKGALQETVRGITQAYWDLVQARLDVWIRKEQIKLSEFTLRREEIRLRFGQSDQADVALARLTLKNFQASLIDAESTLLDREAALRGILGLAPSTVEELVPVTFPRKDHTHFAWDELIVLAERERPDIIELKLVLEADEQLLLQARNRARPRLDAVMLYRWNGLEGEMPIGTDLRSGTSAFQDWQLGVNFSVPIGLREPRAGLRRQELITARDRLNLDQAMLEAVHSLAATVRTLDRFYSQYEAFRETRAAAEDNLRQQRAERTAERIDNFVVLQAITDWGTAVSNEALTLIQYNSALAALEQETGTILESHGIRFFEERYGSLGPLGRWGKQRCYPARMTPGENAERYSAAGRPAEESFDLKAPEAARPRVPERLPPPVPEEGDATE